MKTNQSGFGVIGISIIVAVIGMVAFAGWRVYDMQQMNKTTQTSSTQKTAAAKTAEAKEVKWAVYKNADAGLTFRYPESWQNKVDETYRYEDGAFGGVSGAVTSPDGNSMKWSYYVAGGKGGDCMPAANDVAFATGTACASKQILNVEKAQSVAAPTGKTFRNLFQDSLYITKTKYLASGSDSKLSYQICLDPYYTATTDSHQSDIPKTGTAMGQLQPCAFWDTGFNAMYQASSQAGLSTADAQTAIQIMKSFDSL